MLRDLRCVIAYRPMVLRGKDKPLRFEFRYRHVVGQPFIGKASAFNERVAQSNVRTIEGDFRGPGVGFTLRSTKALRRKDPQAKPASRLLRCHEAQHRMITLRPVGDGIDAGITENFGQLPVEGWRMGRRIRIVLTAPAQRVVAFEKAVRVHLVAHRSDYLRDQGIVIYGQGRSGSRTRANRSATYPRNSGDWLRNSIQSSSRTLVPSS